MLKPCPFCGCEAVLFNEFFDDYLVMCSNSGCAAEGPLKATSDEAETAWNTRPDEVVEALDKHKGEPPEFHDFCERIFVPGTDYRTGDIRMLIREHIKELREIVQRWDAGV